MRGLKFAPTCLLGALPLFAGAISLLPDQPVPEPVRLTLERDRHLPPPLRVTAEDLVLELQQGAAFLATARDRPTGLVLIGRGMLTFSPPIPSEQRQVQLFGGETALTAEFEAAYIRVHPESFTTHVDSAEPREATPPLKLLRQAEKIFQEEVGRSYRVEAGKPGEPPLSALLPPGDFLAELRTRRYGRLAYARVAANPEDIVLLDRERGRTIASYPSRQHMARWGFDYGDEFGQPYEATHYDVEASIDPVRVTVSGRTRLALRALEKLETVSLRLDRELTVSEVRSAEQGRHEFLRQPASDTLFVRLLPPLAPDREIRLEVAYQGSVKTQELAPTGSRSAEPPRRRESAEACLLYSNRTYWFPQSPVRNHATATLRVTVPSGFTVLATGIPQPVAPPSEVSRQQAFFFATEKPIRYLSALVGKFAASEGERSGPEVPLSLHVLAEPRLAPRAREMSDELPKIVRYFRQLIGEVPFPHLTLVLVDTPLPAAHSPAYLVIVGEPQGWNPKKAGDDAAYYAEDPFFFLAHEVAHQRWGQAVGWRNYREQWLSEAFAQYFAALYIREARGQEAFARVLAWMHRWALGSAGQGPVSLGVRAGVISGCQHCFAAIVYNRGAFILHMLRGLLGEEAFLRGLRLYFERWKFRRAGTEDLRRALEEASGLDLARFFEQWVHGDGKPELRWSAAPASEGGRPQLRLTVEQVGEAFELPLAVSIEYHDQPATARLVAVKLRRHEFLFDLQGRFRRVRVNEGPAALCELRERR